MAAIKIDGDFTTAKQLGPTRQIMPFEGVATVYVYEEDFTIYMSSYSPLALNTAHPTISSCYLVRQSTPEIIGGQVCKFTRTYAKVPSAHSEPSSIAYNFIGFAGTFGVNIAAITGQELSMPITGLVMGHIPLMKISQFFKSRHTTSRTPR